MKHLKKYLKEVKTKVYLSICNFVYTLVHRVDQFLMKLRDKI